ncbi:protein IWS1 homolog 1 [Selaginella moellendorffii]|uniref:protein IWS1 homolog 1 n=1 Tax=Selaginella moellendorffii TaxID=88036 RepID=UPI000D1C7011|nr:protein IWS1 homolog 1 [Selaginella moellendorffii]|eukprot:XP_024539384.1 protein IWS1 homolog 1 [Selaginella moellendorffii]
MAEVAKFTEQVIIKLAYAAEEDRELNRQSKPATSKLKMLEFFVGVAEKCRSIWMMKQLVWSGLGMLVRYFLEHKEETQENKLLANRLIEKWSCVVFDTGICQSKVVHDETISSPWKKRPVIAIVEENLDLREKPSSKKRRIPPIIAPQPMTMNFSIRPKSKFDGEAIRESIMQREAMESKRARINKSMKRLHDANRGRPRVMGGRGVLM